MSNTSHKKAKVGRKSSKDKKVTVNLYIRQSTIDKFGGLVNLREHLLNSIESDNIVPNTPISAQELTNMYNWYIKQLEK